MSADRPLNFYSVLATCYPFGFLPKAPGTWGSLPGLLVGVGIFYLSELIVHPIGSFGLVVTVLLILSAFSYLVIHKTEELWNCHDDKSIVIDEVVGQAIPLAFFAPNIKLIVASFILFRVFDITKPMFIGWADQKIHGALGTLLDDVFAGLVVLGLLVLDAHSLNVLT